MHRTPAKVTAAYLIDYMISNVRSVVLTALPSDLQLQLKHLQRHLFTILNICVQIHQFHMPHVQQRQF